MKIVHLLPELNEGGVERGVVELNRELVRHGMESVVVSDGGRLAEQVVADGGEHVRLDVCSKNPLTAPRRIRSLRRVLDDIRPDVIHANSRVPAWLAWFANRRRYPFLTTVHGFNSVNAYSRIMTRGDRVICVSHAVREYVLANYPVDENRVSIIHPGIDLSLFDPDRLDTGIMESLVEEFQLRDRFVVTSVGRITQLKDFETFIRAVALARERRPEICGLVVGGTRQDKQQYLESLKQLVRELAADDIIRFTGSRDNIAEIYRLSDVVVSCSKKPESFGRSVAEALAMGTPVVATRHGGVLDIMREGKDGLLVPLSDPAALAGALLSAAASDCRDRREHIEQSFSLEASVDKTVELYRQMKSGSADEH